MFNKIILSINYYDLVLELQMQTMRKKLQPLGQTEWQTREHPSNIRRVVTGPM